MYFVDDWKIEQVNSGNTMPIVDIKEAKNLQGFNVVNNWYPIEGDTRPGFVNVPMLEATKAGESFTLEFTGTSIGLRNVAGPYTGIIEYSVDGSEFKEVDLFTEWSSHLNLPWASMLETNLDEGNHTLTIITTNKKNPRSKGYGCVIESFLINTDKVLFEEADFNGDGKVNIGDLSIVSKNVGKNFESYDWRNIKIYDINRDRKIDQNDVSEIMGIMMNSK